MILQEDAEKIAEIFRLLGNPTRIKIIRVLGNDEVCVNDLAFQLNMTCLLYTSSGGATLRSGDLRTVSAAYTAAINSTQRNF